MAIALHRAVARKRRSLVGPVLLFVATIVLLTGVALSGGFQLPAQPSPAAQAQSAAPEGPSFDGRGKWTGYTR